MGRFFSLAAVLQRVTAIIMLLHIIGPYRAESVLHLGLREAFGQFGLNSVENFGARLRRRGQMRDDDITSGGVQRAVSVALTIFRGGEFVHIGAKGGHLFVREGLAVHEVNDHGKSALLHSGNSFLVFKSLPSLDVFIIASIGYNVKLRICCVQSNRPASLTFQTPSHVATTFIYRKVGLRLAVVSSGMVLLAHVGRTFLLALPSLNLCTYYIKFLFSCQVKSLLLCGPLLGT